MKEYENQSCHKEGRDFHKKKIRLIQLVFVFVSINMETVVGWKRIAFVLCGVGLFKEFFPSAPFIVEYAMAPEHGNFTDDEVK